MSGLSELRGWEGDCQATHTDIRAWEVTGGNGRALAKMGTWYVLGGQGRLPGGGAVQVALEEADQTDGGTRQKEPTRQTGGRVCQAEGTAGARAGW